MRIGRTSDNVEDRRGTRMGFGGGVGPRIGGLGFGGLLLLVVLGWVLTGNPLGLLGGGSDSSAPFDPGPGAAGPAPGAAPTDEPARFASGVLADTEDTWEQIFAKSNRRYQPPTLVLFSDAVNSACGMNSAAVGPFYCPGDAKIYLDLSFYRELDQRFGAPGDFAQAYVIAHEVGHHVQNLLGIFERVRQMPGNRNAISVAQELQADCFAGVWGHYAAARDRLDPGDVEEGLNAAAAIGDDRMQRRSQGQVTPESWTHGSSEQRVRWFRRGLDTGDVQSCDTFQSGR